MQPRFSPGAIDYDGRMSTNYSSGRGLSALSADVWRAAVAPFVPTTHRARILDLGSGTGRFATLFAASFRAQIIGVEPSRGMLGVAAKEGRRDNLCYVSGTGERLPLLTQSCDLAWLSHVLHHVRDRGACVRELHRVVRPGGYLLIRGTFGDQLDGFPTLFQFWPAARDICQQLPTVVETVTTFEAGGFALREHRRIEQQTCGSLREFAERSRLRADTALTLISDREFDEGQAALGDAAAHERIAVPVVEVIELLVFLRRGQDTDGV
jgi:ubiquinone/menaquinone biosynthesis C-methylase UbiE